MSLGQRTNRPPPGPESAVKARGARASFVLRRLRSARLLPASLLLAVLTSTMVTVGLAGFGARALPAAEHRRLANVSDATIQISGQVGAARADADTRVIHSSVASALGGVGFAMLSGRWSDQLTLPKSRGEIQAPLIQAAVLDGVAAHARLTSGHWPGPTRRGQPIPVALPASTAAMLHFTLGQVLTLPDSVTGARARLQVTGLYRPTDPAAPYWRLSLLGATGRLVQGSFVTYGPMLVTPSAFGPGGLTASQASWLITVDTGQIAPSSTAELGQRLGVVVTSLQTRQDLGTLQAATTLPQTLTALGSSLVVARSLLLIGSLQLILLAVVAAALAARLLATQREEENSLLSARGVARGQLAFASFAEASLLTVAGVLAGTVLGSYLAALLMSASGLPYSPGGGAIGLLGRGLSGGAWWPAAVIAVLVIAVVVRPALRPVTPGAARLRRGRQAALATAARAGLDVAVLALGVVAFWELRKYSAVPRLSGGSLGIDPVLAVAPVLALAGLALLPLRALPAAARLLDRLSARGRHLTAALASWQVARRPVQQGGPILLVVLAVSTGTLVLAQHESWRQSQLDQAAFATGADVRANLAAPLPLGRADVFGHSHGVLAAVPVSNFNSGFDVYALDARSAPGTVLLRPDLATLPPAELWRQFTPARPSPGLVLPGRPARLAVTAAVKPPRGVHLGSLPVSLSVQDGWGIVYPVRAGRLPADGRYHVLTANLTGPGQPAAGQAAAGQAGGLGGARYPLRLLGLSFSYQMPGFPVPPSGPTPATKLTQERIAAANATLDVRALADSAHSSGGFAAPFAGATGLAGWHAAAGAAGLANPRAFGVRPVVQAWRPGTATLTFSVGTGLLIQKPGAVPLPVAGQLALTAGHSAGPLPAIATRAFLGSANTHLGQVIALPVGNATVPVRLVTAIRAFPSAGGTAPAVIVDLGSLESTLAAQSQPPVPVTGWWLHTAPGSRPPLPAGATAVTRARAAAALLGDPLPNVPQLALLVIALAAALLATIGFVVCVVAAVTERRLQDALLAALGVGRSARTGQLCLEQLMLSVPAAIAGALIGVGLAWLLVPAVTLTGGAAAPFPPVHVVIPLGWTAVLALVVAAVPVLTAVVAAAHRPDPAAQLRLGDSA
jgi:FtsX-like permease family